MPLPDRRSFHPWLPAIERLGRVPGQHQLRLSGAILTLALVLVAQTGCGASSPIFAPASPNALAVANLFWFIIIIAVVIFVGVVGALLYALTAFRQRPGREASQFHGNTRLEIIWTVVPVVILIVVFGFTVRTLLDIRPPTGDPLDVTVVAHQWWWELDYASDGFSAANELHVPVGETVIVHLRSADVVHSFWVPALSPKIDAIPGQDRNLWFSAQQPGTFSGACSEFCGVEHTWMFVRVVAQTPAEYAAWVKGQQQPAPTPTGLALQGQQIYKSQTCGSCHAIAGTSSNGQVGPNLTHVASRATIGGGVLENTPENMRRWLANPQAYKPGSFMPNYNLSADQLQALTAYIETLR
jgi:cytochrome c oxidase subunit 2